MLKLNIARKLFNLASIVTLMCLPQLLLAAAFDDQLSIDGQRLYLNGEGPRKKAFLTLYDAALYLTEKGSDAEAIIRADHPMAISIIIRSRFATAERISEAFKEGLEKSGSGNSQAIAGQTATFLDVFADGVVKDDAFSFIYLPDTGLKISKNGGVVASIQGLAFKQALFGIWLSGKPVTVKLKSQLLGG